MTSFSELVGKTLIEILNLQKESSCVIFRCSDGTSYALQHKQSCCEDVSIEDVCGDRMDLLDSPVLLANESVSEGLAPGPTEDDDELSCSWCFYNIATIKGFVTIRWYGTSNGCYSEQAEFVELEGER